MIRTSLLVAATLTALCIASPLQAQTHDASADFSTVSNINGVWSHGYTNTLGSSLNLYTRFVGGGFLMWQSADFGRDPNFAKNTTGSNAFGTADGQVSLHPGPGNQYSVLRFTAPSTNTFTIDSQFYSGDGGDTDVNVLLNSGTASPLFFAATTNTNPTYGASVSLQANDTLDFVIGAKGSYAGDTTPFRVTITTGAVPAPGSLAVGLVGIVPAIGLLLRRRRKS